VVERRVAAAAAVASSPGVARRHPSDAFLSESLPPGWERSFTDDDIPYYVNHRKEVRFGESFPAEFEPTSKRCCKILNFSFLSNFF
jgi:hypothetical protein